MTVRRFRGKPDRWQVDVQTERPDGTVERLRRVVRGSRRDAERFEQEVRASMHRGERAAEKEATPIPTLAAFAPEFWRLYAEAHYRHAELRCRKSATRRILAVLGAIPIDRIGPREAERLRAACRADGLGAARQNRLTSALSMMLRVAESWGLIPAVPRLGQVKTPPSPFRYLDFDEADALLSAADGQPRTMILTALRAGLRRGELRGLKWTDVDWSAGVLRVQRGFLYGQETPPKSGKARIIPLCPSLAVALRAHPRHLHSPWIFCGPDGNPPSLNRMSDDLRRACVAAGLRPCGWHVLRHTFASHAAARGVPLHVIQALLGHANIATTMIYSHALPGATAAAVALLDEPPPLTQNHGNMTATRGNGPRNPLDS